MRRRIVVTMVAALALLGACSQSDESSTTTAAPGGDGSTTTSADDGGPSDGQSGELSLLAYNVAGLPQEISTVNPEKHIPLISPLLEPYDLVLTQEDFDWWGQEVEDLELDFMNYHSRLRADVTHEYQSERHPGPEAVGIDVANDRPTLYVGDGLGMLSRFPFRDMVRVPWEDCFGGIDTSDGGAGDCLAMKGFAVAMLELAPGVEVAVVNLHAEAGGTPADRRFSEEGYQMMAAYLNEHHADDAIIFAGDTNLHTNEDEEPNLDENGEVLNTDRQIWLDFLEATGIIDACDVVTCDDPGRIDKAAFRSNDAVDIEPTSLRFNVEKFVDETGEDLSDHDALEVTFTWRTL
jgi:hypothetical protein